MSIRCRQGRDAVSNCVVACRSYKLPSVGLLAGVTQFISCLKFKVLLIGHSLNVLLHGPPLMDILNDDDELQFNVRPLQLNDLPFCIALEEASFPPNEAATLEKVNSLLRVFVTVDRVPHSRVS